MYVANTIGRPPAGRKFHRRSFDDGRVSLCWLEFVRASEISIAVLLNAQGRPNPSPDIADEK